MPRLSTIILTAGLLGLLSCQNAEQIAQSSLDVEQYSIEDFMNNEAVGGTSFSADESSILYHSNKSGIYNVYEMPLDGGQPVARTQSKGSSAYSVSYFPEDDRILYTMDNDGDEIFHLYMQDENGNAIELTPDSAARASFYGWSADETAFYYGYNKRDPRKTDVYRMDIGRFSSKMIYQNDSTYEFGGISDDEAYMAFVRPVNTNDNDLLLYEVESGTYTQINDTTSFNATADFSPNGEYLYYLTDEGSEYKYLMRYNIASGEREKVKSSNWDISYAYFSDNGEYLIWASNVDGKTEVNVEEALTGKKVDLPSLGDVSVRSLTIADSGEKAALYAGASDSPSNLYFYNLESQQDTQLTQTLNDAIDPDHLVEAEVVRYKSFDSLEIPAIYYKPYQASADSPVPALVYVHGGPGGQSRQTYNAQVQYLVNHGYAVLMVNNRGSSGYGKTFYRMDDQRHGEEDLKDCIWGKKWLADQPYIDSSRIGIMGGSYGGFMVMAALTQAPDEFDVGVNFFGVTNWLRTLKSIPPWWESFKVALYQEMGDPAVDSVRLRNISPLFNAEAIAKPVMVLQGAKDPRVLQVESDEIVEAARQNGVPVEYVLFEDEGHGFRKKENQIEAYRKVLAFLDEHLKEEASTDQEDEEQELQ